MKRLFIAITIIALSSVNVLFGATESRQYTFSFSEADFVRNYDNNGRMYITSNNKDILFDTDTLQPAMPFVAVNICVPENMSFNSFSFTGTPSLIETGVTMCANPEVISTSEIDNISPNNQITFAPATYPTTQIKYAVTNGLDRYKLISFHVSPYSYNASTGDLYFTETFSLTVNYNTTLVSNNVLQTRLSAVNLLKSLAINGDSIVARLERNNISIPVETYEYVIITVDSLRPSFQPLATWKKMKGVSSKIITIEEIQNNPLYNDSTLQLQIKRCLKDYYDNYGLKYVLLGGDNEIVPVQYCCTVAKFDGKVHRLVDMPVDLFYVCFSDNFSWDANRNGIIGEPDDSVSVLHDIAITRAPMDSISQVNRFVNKIIKYEMNPSLNGWKQNILTCGSKIDTIYDYTGKSDAELKGDYLFNHYIHNLNRVKLYDTGNTIAENYDYTPEHLQEQLSLGYNFVDFMSHGYDTTIATANGVNYVRNLASALVNPQPTVITTCACYTNAFDLKDPSLSEAFIRNSNSGVIAYVGGSRHGIVYISKSNSSLSNRYQTKFYDLLTSGNETKFGKIISKIKNNAANSINNNGERWVMYGMNPLGDPEMSIYVMTPQVIDNISINYSNGNLNVASADEYNICVMSLNDNGNSFYEKRLLSDQALSFNINTDVSICIYKDGYVPFVCNIINGILYIKNSTIGHNIQINSDYVTIGSDVISNYPNGKVNFTNTETTISADRIVIENGTKISVDASILFENR